MLICRLGRRHIKNLHKQKTGSAYHCPRCKEDMRSREAVQAHLAVPRDSICSPQEGIASRNPEDGITDRHEFLLNNRKADGKIDNWQDLWHNLFGLDEEVPDPGECFPIVALLCLGLCFSCGLVC